MVDGQLIQELKEIKMDLNFIKEHMVDVDTILTPEEEERLEESLRDLRAGKATSLEEFEKQMKRNVQHKAR